MRTILGTVERATRLYEQRLDERTVETGLAAAEVLVLRYAVENAGATAADIRAALGIKASTLSSLLARLERVGYIRRRAAARDRRSVEVVPTQVGLQAAAIVTGILLDLEADLSARLHPGDLEAVVRIVDAIADLPPVEVDVDNGLPLTTA